MVRSSMMVRVLVVALAVTAGSVAAPREAAAQAFVSPFIGYNFAGDAGCPEITRCENKNLNWGAGLGVTNSLFGFELDFGYVNDFFGESDIYSASVFTLMGNFMLAPRFGPIQPYGLFGVGLIQSKFDPASEIDPSEDTNNDFGWDAGGGLMIHFSQHIGIRGDVRWFYTFDALETLGFKGSDQKLDFGRVSGAVVFRF